MDSFDADHISSCIWSLGLIGYKLNPSSLQASNSEEKRNNKTGEREIATIYSHCHTRYHRDLFNIVSEH